jgi:hypothetical protein
MKNLPKINSV